MSSSDLDIYLLIVRKYREFDMLYLFSSTAFISLLSMLHFFPFGDSIITSVFLWFNEHMYL